MNDWQAQAEERLRAILKELQAENKILKTQIKQLKKQIRPDPRFTQVREYQAREV